LPRLPQTGVLQLALAQALMMTVNTLLLTSSAIIAQQIATNKALATLPLALQFSATMFTTIPASMMMQKWGRKVGFLFASVLGIAGGAMFITAINAQSFALFCVSSILVGIFTGFGNFMRFTAAELVPDQAKNTAISYVLAGGVLAALIGPNLAYWSQDWFSVQYVGNGTMMILLYVLLMMNYSLIRFPQNHTQSYTDSPRPLRQIIRQPVFIVALSSALFGFALMSLLMTATPLAMKHYDHGMGDVAWVIEWHVLGMFAPSFFTGHLINRFGVLRIMLIGAFLILACVLVNLNGGAVSHFWFALFLLGLGWNFLFIGGTTLLTECYQPSEKAKTQALNDYMIFTAVAAASLGSGMLQYYLGWKTVNLMVLPFIVITLALIVWLSRHPDYRALKNAEAQPG